MNIETMIQFLENKSAGLLGKIKVAATKGMPDLYEIFNREWADTQISLSLLKKAQNDIQFYTASQVLEGLISKVKAKKPDLAFYFREESIDAALESVVRESFNEVIQELFVNKLVSLMEG